MDEKLFKQHLQYAWAFLSSACDYLRNARDTAPTAETKVTTKGLLLQAEKLNQLVDEFSNEPILPTAWKGPMPD